MNHIFNLFSNRAVVDAIQENTTLKDRISVLERKNAHLHQELEAHEARLNFIASATTVNWDQKSDSLWLHEAFKAGPGRKFLDILANAERHQTHRAVHSQNDRDKEYSRQLALGLNHVIGWIHHFCNVAREAPEAAKPGASVVKSRDQITEAELEQRLDDMAKGRRVSFSPVSN